MKAKMILLAVAGAMLIWIVAIPGRANGPATASNKRQAPQIQTFVGVLEGTNEPREWINYIIYDDARKSNFFLDDDWKSEKYIGHIVKIAGTLDERNRIIHVQSIEEVK
jgi:hypothetical protein